MDERPIRYITESSSNGERSFQGKSVPKLALDGFTENKIVYKKTENPSSSRTFSDDRSAERHQAVESGNNFFPVCRCSIV